MNDDELWPRLAAFVASYFELAPDEVTPELTADQVEAWDSVQHIAFLVALEREFDVRFHTGEMAELADLGQLAERLASALQRTSA